MRAMMVGSGSRTATRMKTQGEGHGILPNAPLALSLVQEAINMRDINLYEKILDLRAPWKVTTVDLDQSELAIHMHVALPAGARPSCPACGRAECAIKDRRERSWRHLDTCQFKTLIHAPRRGWPVPSAGSRPPSGPGPISTRALRCCSSAWPSTRCWRCRCPAHVSCCASAGRRPTGLSRAP